MDFPDRYRHVYQHGGGNKTGKQAHNKQNAAEKLGKCRWVGEPAGQTEARNPVDML